MLQHLLGGAVMFLSLQNFIAPALDLLVLLKIKILLLVGKK